jgi:hypothetical protein
MSSYAEKRIEIVLDFEMIKLDGFMHLKELF